MLLPVAIPPVSPTILISITVLVATLEHPHTKQVNGSAYAELFIACMAKRAS